MLQHWVSNPLPKKKEFYTIWNNLLIKLTEPKSKMSQYIHKSFSKYIQIKFMYQNIPVRLNDSVGQKVPYRKLLLGLTLAYVRRAATSPETKSKKLYFIISQK